MFAPKPQHDADLRHRVFKHGRVYILSLQSERLAKSVDVLAGKIYPLQCRKHAFGHDELQPLSQTYETWFDLGLTLVDGLDTLLLLGLDSEYDEVCSPQISHPHY